MAQKITIEYCGMPGTGKTVTEAKQDAARSIERALEGDYAPVFAMWRGTAVVASRHPKNGWGYRMVNREFPTSDPIVQSVDHCSCGFTDRRDCIESMLRHIADLEMRADDTIAAVEDLFKMHSIRTDALRKWFEEKLSAMKETRERFRIAEMRGLVGEEARAFAYRDPSRYELWSA